MKRKTNKNKKNPKKLGINDPIVERKKKPPKRLQHFHGYSTSEEHYPETVEDSFQRTCYREYIDISKLSVVPT